jgi:hypothetical protein
VLRADKFDRSRPVTTNASRERAHKARGEGLAPDGVPRPLSWASRAETDCRLGTVVQSDRLHNRAARRMQRDHGENRVIALSGLLV